MSAATTIVVAREDFSIPGGDYHIEDTVAPAMLPECRFFHLLREAKPDVVLLDLSRANGRGVETILKIRRQSAIPILVVHGGDEGTARDYRIAGAVECLCAPIDVVALNEVLQQIVRLNRPTPVPATHAAGSISFSGLKFCPAQNVVKALDGVRAHLTSAESRLLVEFIDHPWELQSRADLAQALYGRHRPATDRAIDVIVNRLRRKLAKLGEPAQFLIKTEFRRGYRLVSDVSVDA
jgi:DNA-binding response OmpR family regulator